MLVFGNHFFFYFKVNLIFRVIFALSVSHFTLLFHNLLSSVCVCVYVPFVAIPVNKLYPQHNWHWCAGSQQMYLLVTKPVLCGVIWWEITKAVLVLDPVLVEVHTAVTSLWTQKSFFIFTPVSIISQQNISQNLKLSVEWWGWENGIGDCLTLTLTVFCQMH